MVKSTQEVLVVLEKALVASEERRVSEVGVMRRRQDELEARLAMAEGKTSEEE